MGCEHGWQALYDHYAQMRDRRDLFQSVFKHFVEMGAYKPEDEERMWQDATDDTNWLLALISRDKDKMIERCKAWTPQIPLIEDGPRPPGAKTPHECIAFASAWYREIVDLMEEYAHAGEERARILLTVYTGWPEVATRLVKTCAELQGIPGTIDIIGQVPVDFEPKKPTEE